MGRVVALSGGGGVESRQAQASSKAERGWISLDEVVRIFPDGAFGQQEGPVIPRPRANRQIADGVPSISAR